MSECGCLFYCINSGMQCPETCEEFIQCATNFFNYEDEKIFNIKNKVINIIPDNEISFETQSFSGIDKNWLKNNNGISETQGLNFLVKFINLFQKKKTIYIIGWKIEDTFLNILNKNNIVRKLNLKYNFDDLKIIDIYKLSTLCFNLFEIGSFTLNSAYLSAIEYDVEKCHNDKFKQWKFNFCSECNNQVLTILKFLMKQNNWKTLLDVYNYLNEKHLLDRMPFGKWKNYTFDYIIKHDFSYLVWLSKQKSFSTIEPDLKFSIETALEKNLK